MITLHVSELGSDPKPGLEVLAARREPIVIDCSGISRIAVGLLTAAEAVRQAAGIEIALDHLGRPTRLALAILEGEDLPLDASGPLTGLFATPAPFIAELRGTGVHVTAHAGMAQHPQLANDKATLWVGGLDLGSFVIDLEAIPHLNSILVAWLLRVSQLTLTVRPTIIKVRPVSVAQLSRLRLDHLIKIELG